MSEHWVLVQDRLRPGSGKDREGETWTDLGRPSGSVQGREGGCRKLCVGPRAKRGKAPSLSCESPVAAAPQGRLGSSFLSADGGSSLLALSACALVARCPVSAVALLGLPRALSSPCRAAGCMARCHWPRAGPLRAAPRAVSLCSGHLARPLPAVRPLCPLQTGSDRFPPVPPRLPARPSLCCLPSELVCR